MEINENPTINEQTQESISFDWTASSNFPNSVKILLDNIEVSNSDRDGNSITTDVSIADLDSGDHVIEVQVSDLADNIESKNFTFTVASSNKSDTPFPISIVSTMMMIVVYRIKKRNN